MAVVTRHATKRAKKRLGIPKRCSEKNAEKALQYGIRHSETTGGLNRYITSLYLRHGTANNIRIYCGNVYIFQNERLITLFPLPQKYRKTADNLKQKKEAGQNES